VWASALPWEAIGQSVLSETIGSLVATAVLAGGGQLVRRVRRRRRESAPRPASAPSCSSEGVRAATDCRVPFQGS
jgi:hypothetical protein